MIDTESLRKKVIDLAIQGKLTEQLSSDGDADSLYSRILEMKEKLINEGRIKKDKVFQPILDEEIPFTKPTNWLFVRFASIITLQSGQDLNASDYNTKRKGIPYITGASNYSEDGKIIINRWTEVPKAYAYRGDILLSCKGTVGKLTILDEEEVHIARQIMGIRTYIVNVRFVRYFIDWMIDKIKSASKGLIPGIERNDILNICFPLPPLSEQARIVDKIEEILLQIDIIDELQKKYSNDLEILKSKIIDAGIRGKLTEQLPEDGTAEELYKQIQEEKARLIKKGKIKKGKKLPDVTEEEVPFDIPDNWKWVRWGQIVNIVSARRVHQTDWRNEGIPFYRAREIAKLADAGFVDNDLFISEELYDEFSKTGIPHVGDLMVSGVGTLGKTYIVNDGDRFYYKDASVLCFENFAKIVPEYLRFVMYSDMTKKQIKTNSGGTTVDTLTMVKMNAYILPIPPQAEQIRIVKKIDELFKLL